MSQRVEFLFKVCYTDENPDDVNLGRIAVSDTAASPSAVLYQYLAQNPMGELVWHNRPEFGAPASVLRHLASVIAASQGVAAGVIPSTKGTEPDVVVKDNGTLSINLGTLYIDRPED